ncbi:MAG TPA: putative baseplate assembly protein, partial [Longimicrobium sp.]|nr:putative baseplate assembly protein [Longimicrobium sp.]
LGIPLRPPAAATGVAALLNERGPLDTVTLPAGLQLFAGATGFVTENGLDVLPVEGKVFYRAKLEAGSETATARKMYAQLFGDGEGEDAEELDFYRTAPMEWPTSGARVNAVSLTADAVDHALWLAVLLRAADKPDAALRDAVRARIAGKVMTLGLAPAWDTSQRVLRAGGGAPRTVPQLSFDISTGTFDGDDPVYRPLDAAADDNALENLTLVQLTLPDEGEFGAWDDLDPMDEGVGDLPPALDDEAIAARVLCWVRIRLADAGTATSPAASSSSSTASQGWEARFSWIGVNAARVAQRIPVAAQRVGLGTGEPDQSLALANVPVLPETVALSVNGEPWARTDDLLAAAPEVPVRDPSLPPGAEAAAGGDPRVFAVDRESGVITFGNGYSGTRPPPGAVIVAAYAYGGGSAGNVGVGAIKTGPLLPAGFKAVNPIPTWGGDDGETTTEAERRIPLHLKTQDRAVSSDDFEQIVAETPGISLGRVEVLATYHPSTGSPAPGVVTLLLVPNDPLRPEAPVPDRLFLDAVCRHLEPRRLVTTEVHLRGPEYVPLSLSVGFDMVAGFDLAIVREAVKAQLKAFLSPLAGGQEGTGWPLDKPVEDRELWAQVARVQGVASVRGVRMWDAGGAETATLPIRGLQLPRLDRLAVRAGDPEDVTATTPTGAAGRRRPVPVVPKSC